MTIELFGLPASGKTYIAEQIKNSRGCERVIVRSRRRLVYATLRFWFRYPIFTCKLFGIVCMHSAGWFDMYSKCMNGLGHRLARYYAPVSSACRVIDEGIVHNIAALSNKPLTDAKIRSLLSSMPDVADAYVHVTVDPDVRNERIDTRGYALSRARTAAEQKMWGSAVQQNMERMYRLLPKYVSGTCFTIKSDEFELLVEKLF